MEQETPNETISRGVADESAREVQRKMLEVQKLLAEVDQLNGGQKEKWWLEIDTMKRERCWGAVTRIATFVTVIVALFGAWHSIDQDRQTHRTEAEARNRQTEEARALRYEVALAKLMAGRDAQSVAQ